MTTKKELKEKEWFGVSNWIAIPIVLIVSGFITVAMIGSTHSSVYTPELRDELQKQYCENRGLELKQEIQDVGGMSSRKYEYKFCADAQGNQYKINQQDNIFCKLTKYYDWGQC